MCTDLPEISCCGNALAHDSPRSARGNIPWRTSLPHIQGSGTPEVAPVGLTQRDDSKREAKSSQGAHHDKLYRTTTVKLLICEAYICVRSRHMQKSCVVVHEVVHIHTRR